jgi:hypothetical protein
MSPPTSRLFFYISRERRMLASLCLSACVSVAPTDRIFGKSDNGDFHEHLSINAKNVGHYIKI